MRERVVELVGGRAKIMWVSTFHSSCVRILRKEIARFGYGSNFSIYDDADSRRLMGLVCRDLDLDPKRYAPRAVLNWVSNCKNELLDPEAAAAKAAQPPRADVRRVLHRPTRRGCGRRTRSTSTT